MKISFSRQRRVLAIDPISRGFGFVVLEGPENLIDWGVKEARRNKDETCLFKLADLIEYYRPDVLVVEYAPGRGSRRCPRVQALIRGIKVMASGKRIKACAFSRSQIREAFSRSGVSTKRQVAMAITKQFPELAPQLPPFRQPWMSEDARMAIFDAVALALTFFHFATK